MQCSVQSASGNSVGPGSSRWRKGSTKIDAVRRFQAGGMSQAAKRARKNSAGSVSSASSADHHVVKKEKDASSAEAGTASPFDRRQTVPAIYFRDCEGQEDTALKGFY